MKQLLFSLVIAISSTCVGQFNESAAAHPSSAKDSLTFLFVHGAWGGGWEYAKVDSILSKKGHRVFHPTLTGLGDRIHLASDSIDLTTHITDVINVIKFEKLEKIVLIGHSYGGMVISGVVEQIPERIDRMIYLDAFVPKNGESIKSINGEEVWNGMILPKIKGGYILYPFGPTLPDPPTDVPQPLKTFTEVLTIQNPLARSIPTAYILMRENGNSTFEAWGSNRALDRGWKVYEMEGGHYSMRDQPDKLIDKLELILSEL